MFANSSPPHRHAPLSGLQMHSHPPATPTSHIQWSGLKDSLTSVRSRCGSCRPKTFKVKRQAVCPHIPSVQWGHSGRIIAVLLLLEGGRAEGRKPSLGHRFLKSLWTNVPRAPHTADQMVLGWALACPPGSAGTSLRDDLQPGSLAPERWGPF